MHNNIIPANIYIPFCQPNFFIKIFANGPNVKAPIPVPAVTRPKIHYIQLKRSKNELYQPLAIARFLSK
jgi:hypothetical protein